MTGVPLPRPPADGARLTPTALLRRLDRTVLALIGPHIETVRDDPGGLLYLACAWSEGQARRITITCRPDGRYDFADQIIRPHPWRVTDLAERHGTPLAYVNAKLRELARTNSPPPLPRRSKPVPGTPSPAGRLRPGDQPLPIPNDHPSIHDLVITNLRASRVPELAAVADALADRRALGLDRYQSILQPFNGRDALRDLLDEILDAIVYARQVVLEATVSDVNEFEAIETRLVGLATRVQAAMPTPTSQETPGA